MVLNSDGSATYEASSKYESEQTKGSYAYYGLPFEMRTSMSDNIDDNGNITFNYKSRNLFDNMVKDMNLNAQNVIAYCKDDGIRL